MADYTYVPIEVTSNSVLSKEALDILNASPTAFVNNNKALGLTGLYSTGETDTSLTHDRLLTQTIQHINSATMSRRTYVIIPFTTFDPHTDSDIDKLLGVDNEERTHFNPLKGRWDEMFRESLGIERVTKVETLKYDNDGNPVMVSKTDANGNNIQEPAVDDNGHLSYDDDGNLIMVDVLVQAVDITEKTSKYEYYFCYYRGDHLPFGVLVSWDPNNRTFQTNDDGSLKVGEDGNFLYEESDNDDANLLMAKEKYSKFVYPKYYYFLPTKAETVGAYAAESSNLQLTDVLEATFNLVNTLINGAIATNKKYIRVLWGDINKTNPDYVKSQFYTEDNTVREHSWTVDDTISIYSTRTTNDPNVTITKTETFSIKSLLSATAEDDGLAYTYTEILDPSKVPLGFILSWHDASDTTTQESIDAIITSYGTTSEGDEEVLVLPVFNYADQAKHKLEIRKTMRSSYIKTIADKIQSKLTSAFNKSETSIAILWTEISSSNAKSVKTEWAKEDYFSKKLESKPYDDDSEIKEIATDTAKNIYGALHILNICTQVGSNTGDTTEKVYWDYIHYKDIYDKVNADEDDANADGEVKVVEYTRSNSCGIALAYGAHDAAQTAINAVKESYYKIEDPAKKSNNS